MAGIISIGAHIPVHRLSRAVIGQSWETRGIAGERAVANYDEDSLTMAVAAARNCLKHFTGKKVGALYFATTTAPYMEKQSAALMAAVLSLPEETQTLDFSNSLRSGTSAISAALNAINSGAADTVLVCAADMRISLPKSHYEMFCGDGAVAFLLGKEDLIAEIEWVDSYTDEIQDVWRMEGERFIRTAEDRFVQDLGYARVVRNSVSKTLKKRNARPEQFSKVCGNFTDPKSTAKVIAKLGFNPEEQLQAELNQGVGDAGAAMSLLNAAHALEKAAPGQSILVTGYGNGCDVLSIRATEKIGSFLFARRISDQVNQKIMMSSYNKYLIWRGLIDVAQTPRPPLVERQPTPPAQWREVKGELVLNGTRCQQCGTPQYPPQRVCMVCKTKDKMDRYNFNRIPAKVATFSNDYIMETLDSPVTTTVVDFYGGGRMICDMTDRKLEEIVVGMELEMTFRKLYSVGGIINYWWKCTPVRQDGQA
jgi:3-hydroxy-3-methylglutaryl CoA synthase